MKLASILLLGANLIAAPCAVAADDTGGNWLKASLAEIKQETCSTTQVVAKKKPTVTAKRATTPGATAVANHKPVMLRAFQPGRALPRQKDLVSQYAQLDNSMSAGLMPQQASMDPQASQLSGRVCAFQQPGADAYPNPYQQWAGVAARAAKNEAIARPVRAAVQKVMAKAPANLVPPQLAAMPIHGAPLQESQSQPQQQPQQMVAMMPPVSQPMMPAMQQPMQMHALQRQNQGPIFSQEDEAALNRILSSGATRDAGTGTGDMTTPSGNPASGAGQAPFPLNLLFGTTGSGPTQKPNNPLVGKPKFGQWHQKNQLSYGGFGGSNITHGTKRRKNVTHPVKKAARPSTSRQIVTGAKKRFAPPANLAQNQTSPNGVRMPATVAQYPPYQGNYSRPF